MAFLNQSELEALGIKSLGKGVRISNRAAIHNPELLEIGDHSRVDDFCVVSGKVTIGRNVHLAVFCNIAGGELGIALEDFSGLAYGCQVFTQSDDYTGKTLTNPTVPDQYKEESKQAVRIGRHCIVGTQSLVFPGGNLAEGTSVGACSMVTKPTKAWSVYFGVPAKRIKARRKDLLELEKQYLQEESEGQHGG